MFSFLLFTFYVFTQLCFAFSCSLATRRHTFDVSFHFNRYIYILHAKLAWLLHLRIVSAILAFVWWVCECVKIRFSFLYNFSIPFFLSLPLSLFFLFTHIIFTLLLMLLSNAFPLFVLVILPFLRMNVCVCVRARAFRSHIAEAALC